MGGRIRGTPVVTSAVSSLPEVAGEAAVYVDPLDVGSISDGIERVLSDAALRSELVRKGLEQAALFAPSRVARMLWNVYLEALDG